MKKKLIVMFFTMTSIVNTSAFSMELEDKEEKAIIKRVLFDKEEKPSIVRHLQICFFERTGRNIPLELVEHIFSFVKDDEVAMGSSLKDNMGFISMGSLRSLLNLENMLGEILGKRGNVGNTDCPYGRIKITKSFTYKRKPYTITGIFPIYLISKHNYKDTEKIYRESLYSGPAEWFEIPSRHIELYPKNLYFRGSYDLNPNMRYVDYSIKREETSGQFFMEESK